MSTLTIRGVSDALHERLKERAERNRRSLNAETVLLLEQALYLMPEESVLRERYLADEIARAEEQAVLTSRAERVAALDGETVRSVLRSRRRRLRDLGVQRIGLFGSVARGESRNDSDVDLVVEFAPGEKSYARFLTLAAWLEELLGRRVDLITTEALSPWIGPRILEEAEFVAIGD